ncbi:hypothetical protein LINPERHAP1_LOCUS4543 [Linum perenne]
MGFASRVNCLYLDRLIQSIWVSHSPQIFCIKEGKGSVRVRYLKLELLKLW